MSRYRRLVTALLAVALVAASVAGTARMQAAPLDDGRYVLLVLGSDAGSWRPGSAVEGRADAIQLVVVETDQRAVSIVSIPRDTWTPVPGFGTTKINAGLTDGPEPMVGAVEELTGLDVDDWIVTTMGAYVDGIDAFGGVTADVEQRLQVHNNVLTAGRQELAGTAALVYTRDRKNRPSGDFGRSRAQSLVLQSLHDELQARDPGPAELMGMIADLRRNTVTSIPPARMIRLAWLAVQIDPEDVAVTQADGAVGTAGSASVVRMTDAAEAMFADLREDGMLAELEPTG